MELLIQRVQAHPERLAYRFIERTQQVHEVTWAHLWHQAATLAGLLLGRHLAGERVLLACHDQWRFVQGYAACLLAGAVAVPAPDSSGRRLHERLRALAADALASFVLCDTDAGTAAAQELGLATLDLRKPLPPDGLAMSPGQWPRDGASAASLAFLQYTSGSTGDPKGVMVTQGNVLANCAAIAQAMAIDVDSRVLTPLPLFHDMGLVGGVMQPLFSGCVGTFMRPAQVVQQPMSWLRTIDAWRITHSGGPNFMFDMLLDTDFRDAAGLDLSSWQVAYCGAEPIRASTWKRFQTRFASHGLRPDAFFPCYGLAEATLFVTGGGAGVPAVVDESLSPSEQLSCGFPRGPTCVEIIDPDTLQPARPGSVGEVWVRGPSVAAGYWGRPESSKHLFQAFVPGRGDGPYLRTGDLGRVRNGHLHLSGRMKDLIIVRGRKFAPQDLEQEVERCHEAVQCSAALCRGLGEGPGLVLLVETRRDWLRRPEDRRAVCQAIGRALFCAFQLQADCIELLRPLAIPRTSSGKLRRAYARELFLAGQLCSQVSMPPATAAAIDRTRAVLQSRPC